MMRLFASAITAFVLLVPQLGFAGPIGIGIDLTIEEPALIAIGTAGANLFWDYVTEISVEGTTKPAGGELTFETSTLLSLIA